MIVKLKSKLFVEVILNMRAMNKNINMAFTFLKKSKAHWKKHTKLEMLDTTTQSYH